MSESMIELENAMRIEKMRMFWARYGGWLVGLALAAIIIMVAVIIWRNVMEKRYTAQSLALMTILEMKTQTPENTVRLANLAQTSNAPLNDVVQFYTAQNYEHQGDLEKAQQAYKDVMDRSQASIALKNLAIIHFVRIGLLAKQDAARLMPFILPLTTNPQQAFYGSASELRGLLLIQQGKTDEANKIFTELSTADTVPATLRQRAKSMISYEQTHAE